MLGVCIPQKGLDSTCNSDNECDDSQMLSCIDEKCVCRVGYSKTSEGLCALGYNQECSKENVCSDEFICTQYHMGIFVGDYELISAKCLCPNSELQVYDGNVCIGVIGGPCNEQIGCIENAHCVNRVCECQEGFVEYDIKHCDVAYGFECEPKHGWSLHLFHDSIK